MKCPESHCETAGLWCPPLAHLAALALRILRARHWRWPRRIVSRTKVGSVFVFASPTTHARTFEPSHTASECFAYCSTIGRMLVVTMRCARLKLWSISTLHQLLYTSARPCKYTLQGQGDCLLQLFQLLRERQISLLRCESS